MHVLGATDIARLFGGRADASGLPLTSSRSLGTFGDGHTRARVESGDSTVQMIECPTQEAALKLIASIIEADAMSPELQGLARIITSKAPARDDWAELSAIFNACKNGRADLKRYGLEHGVRYLADARTGPEGEEADVFFAPTRVLKMLQAGENGFDCDDATMFVGALVKNCGFRAGARAYGQGEVAGYEHVYPVALIPKRGPWNYDAAGKVDESHVVGLDITVPTARVGWQPPRGDVFTALLD